MVINVSRSNGVYVLDKISRQQIHRELDKQLMGSRNDSDLKKKSLFL